VDRRPPVLVRTEPDTFATLTDLGSRVRFFFDERISEEVAGGQLSDAITVSPRTGAVRVSHGRRDLSVQVEGGFRPGLVYRVTLLPVIRDMFGNQLRDPYELVFSTGGEAPPTAIAGQVWNRANGTAMNGASVRAVSADSLLYVARTDQSGIYAFRYLPEGEYVITAFDDIDRDGELDAREAQGSVSSRVAVGDTVLINVPTLPWDTTAAVAVGATAMDSVTIALEFDDYLETDEPAADVVVVLTREDGTAPSVTRLFHEREYGAYVQAVTDSLARLDSIDAAAQAALPPPAVDTAAAAPADSAADVPLDAANSPVARALRPTPVRLEGTQSAAAPGTGYPLPTRRLVGLLDVPLEVGVRYQVRVDGVVNIRGVPDGGGEVTVERRPPPTPAAPPDGAGAPGAAGAAGAAGAVPDTLGVRR